MQKYAQPNSITAEIAITSSVARKINSSTLDDERQCRLHTHRQCLSCDLQIMSNDVHENDVVINVIQGRIMMYFIEATVCFFFVVIISHLSLQVFSRSLPKFNDAYPQWVWHNNSHRIRMKRNELWKVAAGIYLPASLLHLLLSASPGAQKANKRFPPFAISDNPPATTQEKGKKSFQF